ncbi:MULTISPECIES: hypothetical protein [Vibrio]|uniref:Uncharacterized protein n=1 Tax=Vibrio tasmaniensis TaxID=212663 RepID=A0A2N7NCS3_9VIBR|nr:hypothetical protein [Vibrio tasmaniensis]PMO89825.1 hypothetical protein BCT01_00655 [Vibrio tasmaniensis]PMP10002.1 hypothetical protein BCS92_02435 [Vibrio tasmaniensis]TKG32613.1 hypothetical protein FC057_12415 [Vibrio tasmaniensis]TKG41703.1 hypothetical protein FC063_07525 [Vibrio tasmaniensis]TKG52058.1 hypothetical protein FC070_09795 [Vibrio tasmaniensis]
MRITQEDSINHYLKSKFDVVIVDRLDSGSFGTCFELSNGHALKVTTSLSEGVYAARCLNQKMDNVTDIHNVVCFQDSDFIKNPIFLIEQDLVDTNHDRCYVAGRALSLLDESLFSIYDFLDLDDMRDEIRYQFEAEPELMECIEELQNGIYQHQALGNMAADVKEDNFGVKYIAGQPVLCLFDQMNLGLERQLKFRFHLEEHLEPSQLDKVLKADFRVVRKELAELVSLQNVENVEDLTYSTDFNM